MVVGAVFSVIVSGVGRAGREGRRFVDVGHLDGDVLVDQFARRWWRDDDIIDIVGAGIGRSLEVARRNEAQLAVGAVEGKECRVRAAEREGHRRRLGIGGIGIVKHGRRRQLFSADRIGLAGVVVKTGGPPSPASTTLVTWMADILRDRRVDPVAERDGDVVDIVGPGIGRGLEIG